MVKWIINNIVPFVIIALATRSLILLVKSWGHRSRIDSCIYILVSAAAIAYSLNQLVDGYNLHDRGQYTVMVMFTAFCYAIMRNAKQNRDEVFSLPNMIKQHYSYDEQEVLYKIGVHKKGFCEIVTAKDLEKFQVGKIYYAETLKEALTRLEPIGDTEVIRAFLDAGGEFGLQKHPDMNERCQIILGRVKDKTTGKIFTQGEEIEWPANTAHNLKGLEYSEMLAFLEKINITSAH